MKLSVFNLGDLGVNLTTSPLHTEDGEWVRLRNAALELRGADHGMSKRPGLGLFTSGLAGAVFGLINAGVLPTPPPEEGPGTGYGPAALHIMRCKLYLSAATTSIADNTEVVLDWTAEAWDVGNLHDLDTNPSRLTVPTDGDGLYLILAQAQWATKGNVVLKRALRILKNGTEVAQAAAGANDDGDPLTHQVAAIVPALAADYFEVSVEQDTGGASDLVGGGEGPTWVTAIRLVATTTWRLPRVHAYRTTNLTLTKDTPTVIGLDAEAFDSHTMHDLVANNSRLTVPADQGGLYYVCGHYARQNQSNGYVVVELLKNGTQVLAVANQNFINANTDPDATGQVTGAFVLEPTDYVELRATYRFYGGAEPSTSVLLGDPVGAIARTGLLMARIG